MKKLIVGNLKSNKSLSDLDAWLDIFGDKISKAIVKPNSDKIEVSIAPAFPFIPRVKKFVNEINSNLVNLAVQDISSFPVGSYTGAISTYNLDGFDVKYAIVGHSERRRYFHETSQDVALKVEQALLNNMVPIVCVDEPYLEEQSKAIDPSLLEKCLVAYEPLEAIGSGNIANVADVKRVKLLVNKLFGDVPVLYGGSVDDLNINEFLLVADGVLVGTAALNATTFGDLVINSIV